ncbi:oxygenase [Lithospermum erythrorhizon]|uniref:Oxygenase n=1 Tax=Lithospermum erythrorhizon TaxID=34254 RepID=A0AAV3QLE2_LITER
MALIWKTILVVIAITALLDRFLKKIIKKRRVPLPPSPKGLPILGHLHLLGKNPHQDLHKLSKEHGPIMYMKFGMIPNIIVSSPDAAEQFLKTHDLVFASRPPHEAAKYISYDQTNLSFAPYGHYWRNMRKLCTLELLSNMKINSFHPMRSEEISNFIDLLKSCSQDRSVVDLSSQVSTLNTNMTCRMIFGKKYTNEEFGDKKGFEGVIQEGMQLAAKPNLGDYFPYLGKLDLQGLTARFKAVSAVFDAFFEKVLDEHEQQSSRGHENQEGKNMDFVDTMLGILTSGQAEFTFDRRHVKAVLLDMLAGAMDTSATVIDWTMSELLRHPTIMKNVQSELEQVVGLNRIVEESDLGKLEYLNMVVKESMRLHPVAPLLIPHEALEDCTVEGYHIPKKSRVIINAWSIGRDPEAWSDPEKFIPKRFQGSKIDVRGRDFQLIPFGSGRRGCPGIQLGLIVVSLVVAQLVHCFDWELPNGMLNTELDMSEEFGLVTTRAGHLMAIPTYRLNV